MEGFSKKMYILYCSTDAFRNVRFFPKTDLSSQKTKAYLKKNKTKDSAK